MADARIRHSRLPGRIVPAARTERPLHRAAEGDLARGRVVGFRQVPPSDTLHRRAGIAQHALPRDAVARIEDGELPRVEARAASPLLAVRLRGPYPAFEAHGTAFHDTRVAIGVDPAGVATVSPPTRH